MTCAFTECAAATRCCLVGGCVNHLVPRPAQLADPELPRSKALNGTTLRPSLDPAFIRRPRKAIAR